MAILADKPYWAMALQRYDQTCRNVMSIGKRLYEGECYVAFCIGVTAALRSELKVAVMTSFHARKNGVKHHE
jgi:hypothetical protein